MGITLSRSFLYCEFFIMKKTKEDIERKYQQLFNEVVYRCKCKSERKAEELRRIESENFSRQFQKYQRKLDAYIRKKQIEYDRKMKNEIRKLEWKPEREYKVKKKKLNVLEFAMELAQENAKLRDTDADWFGFCISCNQLREWHELAGWHFISRRVKNICIHPANINAQCHNCNLITWPLGNIGLKFKVQETYRANLVQKFSKGIVEQLEAKNAAYFQKWYETNWDYGQWHIDLEDHIFLMIQENEERWKSKNFYKPKKNWRKVRDLHCNKN